MQIQDRWPATNPDVIQLYSLATPNGVKVSIALEELGLRYEAHKVDITTGDQLTPEFLSLNPNNKIPAIIDPHGPGEEPFGLWETGAILQYLADKTGKLLPRDGAQRYEVLQWLSWQVGGLGPMMGQVGFFHKYAGREFEDKRPLQRYVDESARLLRVLDKHLVGREWIVDEYSIADIAVFPWVRNFVGWYEAGELVDYSQFKEVDRVLQAFLARPAVQRGLAVPA